MPIEIICPLCRCAYENICEVCEEKYYTPVKFDSVDEYAKHILSEHPFDNRAIWAEHYFNFKELDLNKIVEERTGIINPHIHDDIKPTINETKVKQDTEVKEINDMLVKYNKPPVTSIKQKQSFVSWLFGNKKKNESKVTTEKNKKTVKIVKKQNAVTQKTPIVENKVVGKANSSETYACELCGEVLQSSKELARHIMDKHSCHICNEIFNNTKDYYQHMLDEHPEDKIAIKANKYLRKLNEI